MQIKLFTIPITDNETALSEMNRFLAGHKILTVDNQLVRNNRGAYWCFCICYTENPIGAGGFHKSKRVDYKKILDEETFQKFSKLREIRKKVAADEGIPAYAVFTDEELAGLAKLETITRKSMLSVKGIGDKKMERFAEHFLTSGKTGVDQKEEKDETTGTLD